MTKWNWLDTVILVCIVLLMGLILTWSLGCGGTRAVVDAAKHGAPGKDLVAQLNWLVVFGILGIGASVAVGVWLGQRLMAAAGIAGFGAIIACALLLQQLKPYLPWITGALVAVGVIWIIWKLWKATNAAVAFGSAVAKVAPEAEVLKLKADHAAEQAKAGVQTLIQKAIAKVSG